MKKKNHLNPTKLRIDNVQLSLVHFNYHVFLGTVIFVLGPPTHLCRYEEVLVREEKKEIEGKEQKEFLVS